MSFDPIGDMLTSIRNANMKNLERVDVPNSSLKREIAQVLKQEGYISDFKVLPDRKQGVLRIMLRYLSDKSRVIQKVERISRPGLRVYRGWTEMQKVRGGLGISIVSTSKGVMSDKDSRKQKVGGEVLARLW